jgi:membrane protein
MADYGRKRRSGRRGDRLSEALVTTSLMVAGGAMLAAAFSQPRKPESRVGADAAIAADASSGAHDPHGRSARTPTDFPARGWKEIILRLYAQMTEDRLLAVAAGVTFYALLAMFPALVALVSLYGLTADLASLNDHLATFEGLMPAAALELVREHVARIVLKSDGTLGLAFAFGLCLALWSANAGVKAVFDALNVVYEEREKRSFIRLNLWSLTFTVGAILFLLLAFNAVVVLPLALDMVGLGRAAETLIALGRWPVLFAVVMFGLTLLYRYGPSRSRPKWRWATPGSLVAAALWLAGSVAFSWYAENFASYNETYGSLGAAIGFMTWIWMSVIVVLLGGELNAEMEHQTAKDTTTGAPLPMGTRGARMADTVAPVSG